MLEYLEGWVARKRERRRVSIHESRSTRFKFVRPLGPRGQFAVVYLRADPANAFAFTSAAEWPRPECDCTVAVLDGILDELLAVDLGPAATLMQLTLEKIEWHDVDSSAVAFYNAARGAVRELLGRDQFHSNINIVS